MKITPDPSLVVKPFDLGVRVLGDELHAPPQVHALLKRLGVHDAGVVLHMFDDLPSLFLHELALAQVHLPALRAALEREVGSVTYPLPEPSPVFRYGALIPPTSASD